MNTMEKLDSAISEVLACDLDREDKIIIFSLMADICLEQARSLRSHPESEVQTEDKWNEVCDCCFNDVDSIEALFHHLNSYTINVLLEKEENENG